MKLVFTALLFFIAPAIAHAFIGEITTLNGEASISRGDESLSAARLMEIKPQDVINTSDASNLVISFKDGSRFTVGANSTVTIDKFVYDYEQKSGESLTTIGKGVFRYIGGQIPKKNVKFNTPVSTIGIRGTEFFGEVKDDGATLIGLVQCCVDLSTDAGTVAIDEEGTFSKATSRDTLPSTPIVCDRAWVDKAAAKLGITPQELNYE